MFADIRLDGRDEWRMSVRTPTLYDYLMKNYSPVEPNSLPEPYRLYRRTTPFPDGR
jgi:hypothetical protein